MPRAPSATANQATDRDNTVFVINKLPAGLTVEHPVGAFWEKKRTDGDSVPPTQVVNLNGAHDEALRRGMEPTPTLAKQFYGITPVDRDWYEHWSKHHPDFYPLRAGLIDAFPTLEAAKAAARDRIKEQTGVEPLNMPLNPSDKDPLDPRVEKSDQVELQAADNKE